MVFAMAEGSSRWSPAGLFWSWCLGLQDFCSKGRVHRAAGAVFRRLAVVTGPACELVNGPWVWLKLAVHTRLEETQSLPRFSFVKGLVLVYCQARSALHKTKRIAKVLCGNRFYIAKTRCTVKATHWGRWLKNMTGWQASDDFGFKSASVSVFHMMHRNTKAVWCWQNA